MFRFDLLEATPVKWLCCCRAGIVIGHVVTAAIQHSSAGSVSIVQRLAADFMAELERTKLRLNVPTSELPVHNRYAKKQRPAGAVQTNLTALPALDWGQYSQQQPSAPPMPMGTVAPGQPAT